ncbi:MAG: TIGR00730 family Rossman fold protein, partial [Proteobacteria bacterium]|nr:TIGR00730 family Rossman fold protein [Pseudomonadota bacterium]
MQNIRSIAVFCGSKAGANPAHSEAAARFGRILAAADIRLVYGGGRIGLMGIVADAVMEAGGAVTGVIPRFISEFEVAHQEISKLIEVESMHERKNKMFEVSDAFVILPGGLGTLDEAMEIITWKQLKLHSKPI